MSKHWRLTRGNLRITRKVATVFQKWVGAGKNRVFVIWWTSTSGFFICFFLWFGLIFMVFFHFQAISPLNFQLIKSSCTSSSWTADARDVSVIPVASWRPPEPSNQNHWVLSEPKTPKPFKTTSTRSTTRRVWTFWRYGAGFKSLCWFFVFFLFLFSRFLVGIFVRLLFVNIFEKNLWNGFV